MTRLCSRSRRGFTLVELLVVILLIPLVAIGCYASMGRSRETANRVKCASNLRQIGQAILLYQNENKGAYPRAVWAQGVIVIPTWGTGASAANPFEEGGPQPNDVTAALFLLLRTQDITAEVFTCPSSNAEKDLYGDAKTPLKRSNFTDVRKNLSYSYQNPYPDDRASEDINRFRLRGDLPAEFAVASDLNPGTTGSNQNVFAVNVNSGYKEMRQGNSANHDTDGQNVLYYDGHVEWQQNPFVGVERNNIYTVSDEKGGNAPTLLTSQYDRNDSILLPTDD